MHGQSSSDYNEILPDYNQPHDYESLTFNKWNYWHLWSTNNNITTIYIHIIWIEGEGVWRIIFSRQLFLKLAGCMFLSMSGTWYFFNAVGQVSPPPPPTHTYIFFNGRSLVLVKIRGIPILIIMPVNVAGPIECTWHISNCIACYYLICGANGYILHVFIPPSLLYSL